IDEILSTPGVDAVYVGPADLSLTLGCTAKLDQDEPPVVAALDKILAACKRHKVVAGLHNGTSAYAQKMAAQGWQFVTLASDAGFIDAIPKLEIIAVFGVGYDAVNLDRTRARKLGVTSTADVRTEDVAEMARGLMLAVARRRADGDRFVRQGRWLKDRLPLGR